MEVFNQIPDVFYNFLITLLLSLLIGFEQRKRADQDVAEADEKAVFGTDRTFAFIGSLGFILFVIEPKNMIPFITGAAIVALFLAVYYWQKAVQDKSFGLTSVFVALITYSLGPVVVTQPKWLTVLIAVSIFILVERKAELKKLSRKIDISEYLTLGKFLLIAAVILPITPREPRIPYIDIAPYDIWLTVVVVSSISYVSYILQRFIVPKAGVLISGLLGGLYSSTATTFILSRKTRQLNPKSNIYASAIIASTGMMYLRVLVLMFIFNYVIFIYLLPFILALFLITTGASTVIYFVKKPSDTKEKDYERVYKNPLELKIALLFGAVFILFSAVTQFAIQTYGTSGLDVLSYIVGFTDIDPFLLNILQGHYPIDFSSIARAVLQAIVSNNILKAGYMLIFANNYTRIPAGLAFLVIIVVNFIFTLIV